MELYRQSNRVLRLLMEVSEMKIEIKIDNIVFDITKEVIDLFNDEDKEKVLSYDEYMDWLDLALCNYYINFTYPQRKAIIESYLKMKGADLNG